MFNIFRQHISFLHSFDTYVSPILMILYFVHNNMLCVILFSESLERTESPTVKFADDEAADSESSAPSGKLIEIY